MKASATLLLLIFGFIFVHCDFTFGNNTSDGSFVKKVELTVYLAEKYHRNLMFLERWTYFFETPHSQIFRTLPAGYSPNRKTNNDGIGGIVVAANNSVIHEVLPSLHTHQPNTFEVFEDEENLHIYVHFPPTTGEMEFIFAYEVAGGLIFHLLPMLKPTTSSLAETLYWPIISSNNPLPVHNITIEFNAQREIIPNAESESKPFKPAAARISVGAEPQVIELYKYSDDVTHVHRVGWPEDVDPLPPKTEYMVKFAIKPKSQTRLMKLSKWQRSLLTQDLCNYSIGAGIIAATFLPMLSLLYYRSKWVEIFDFEGKTSNKAPPAPKDLLSVSVLLDNMRIQNNVWNLLHANWIYKGILIVRGDKFKLHKNYKNKAENNVDVEILELLFDDKDSRRPTAMLTPKEYGKRVRASKNKILGIAIENLIREGFLYKDLRAALRDFRLLCCLQGLLVFVVVVFSTPQSLVQYWMEIENFYLINGCLFIIQLLAQVQLNTRSTKGAVSRAWWLGYLHRNIDDENKIEQNLLEAFRWGKEPLTRAQSKEWIDANMKGRSQEERKHFESFLYSICE